MQKYSWWTLPHSKLFWSRSVLRDCENYIIHQSLLRKISQTPRTLPWIFGPCDMSTKKIGAWKIKMPTVKRPFGLSTHFWLRNGLWAYGPSYMARIISRTWQKTLGIWFGLQCFSTAIHENQQVCFGAGTNLWSCFWCLFCLCIKTNRCLSVSPFSESNFTTLSNTCGSSCALAI